MTTEERILDGALQVFSRRGYKNSSIKEIARKAEVNSLTIFRYFHDKETLFFSAIESVRHSRFDAAALNARLSFSDVEADIAVMAKAYLEEIYANMPLMRIYIGESLNFAQLREAAWFISPVLKEHFVSYMRRLGNLTPLAQENSELCAEMFVSYITRKAMPANKSGTAQFVTPEIEALFWETMPAQANCMKFILTGQK